MSTTLGDKVVTVSVLLAALGVVGWVKVKWFKRWWTAVNHHPE